MGRKYCITLILLVATLKLTAQSGFNNLEFIENKGQWDSRVRYMGNLKSGEFFLQNNGFTVALHHPEDMHKMIHRHHMAPTRDAVNASSPEAAWKARNMKVRSHAYAMRFEGASEKSYIVPDKPLPGHNNYFIGNDPSKWASNVKVYQAVLYKNVYHNIDVRYYTESGQLKYDIIINPGADISKIAMTYAGVDKLSVKNGELIIKTSVGEVKELYPYTYQHSSTGRRKIECSFQLTGNTVRFKVGEYDKQSVLVIDPTLIFSSFTGSTASQFGFTATPGPDGSLFSGGIVFGAGFPTNVGAYDESYGGGLQQGVDIGIFKFNSTGTSRVYATYLGGGDDDYPHSLIADPQGNLVILGRTYSGTGYPATFVGTSPGGADIVVTKLNANGNGLIGSLRIGGSENDGVNIEDQQRGNPGKVSILRNYGDDSRSEVILDDAGFIYVAAQTQSRSNFPIRPSAAGVFQGTFGGGTQDAAIIKIDPNCSNIVFSSYLGGTGNDGAFGIKVSPQNGNIYVVGATSSNDFPGDKTGTIGGTYVGGECDGYIATISNDGQTLLKSTYLGTTAVDVVYALQFDNLGFPYIMGTTRGSWRVVNAAYSNANSKQFISKLRPDLSDYVYSTTFGTSSDRPNISPVAFLVDRCENVYASGWGGWIVNGPDPYELAGTSGMPTTPDAIKRSSDNKDFYFIVIEKNAASLLYGSFFGQNGGEGEHVDGGTSRFDRQGAIYQAICANCLPQSNPPSGPYPTTPGVWAPNNLSGDGCDLNAVKIAFNFSGVESAPKAHIGGVGNDTVGCVPLRVDFSDTLQLGQTYEWDFDGDGVTDQITNQPVGVFTYNAVGTFRVRLIAVDSTTCNIRDTAYLTIIARDDEARMDFNMQKVGGCQSLEFRFTNLSVPPPGKPFTNTSFKWDFGDGSPTVITGTLAVNHTFPRPDTYKVKLILIDTNYCNSPDTLEKELRIAPDVDAQFSVPLSGCVPYNAQFQYTGTAGQEFFWTFGDGNTSTLANPTNLYTATGTYTVKLVVIDSGTCNIIDSVTADITVHSIPTAAFTFAPVPAEENTPTTFFNNSIGGARYVWHFGDGDSTIRTTMDTVKHQYNATGTFNACLVTINQFGCADTVCSPVQALIKPLLDVPNAFTPGRPGSRGKNHIVKPEGFGMARVLFRIYNRWGQKLFETTNPREGWDGTFRGVLQPMDVYVYTLEVEFTDGTRASRKGDITLIR